MAKRMDAPYRPGRRVHDWLKVKTRQELEVVIGGFTEGAGSRRGTVGALLVGERGADGALTYLSHVGSGLIGRRGTGASGTACGPPRPTTSPFANEVPDAPAPPRWVRPEITCEVRFAERTADGRLRAPVFHGLVEDAVADVPSGPFSRRTAARPWRRASAGSPSPTSTSPTGRARASPRGTSSTTTCAWPRCSCPTWWAGR